MSDYEDAFVELSKLGQKTWTGDEAKKRRVIMNVSATGLTWLSTVSHKKTFTEVCYILRDHALKQEHMAKEKAMERAYLSRLLPQASIAQVNRLTRLDPVQLLALPRDRRDLISKIQREEYSQSEEIPKLDPCTLGKEPKENVKPIARQYEKTIANLTNVIEDLEYNEKLIDALSTADLETVQEYLGDR